MKRLLLLLVASISLYCCTPNDSEVTSQVLFTMFNDTDKAIIVLGFSRDFDLGTAHAAQEIRIDPHSTL